MGTHSPHDAAYQVGAASAVIALTSLFDAWATWLSLRLGYQELNPLMSHLNLPGGEAAIATAVALKAVAFIGIAYWAWKALAHGRPMRPVLLTLRVVAYTYLAVAAYHVTALSRLFNMPF
ncbi:MAG: DUF5658 family protein [Armatimonadota bacterium]|nr:DUF5658 family protein [Armatimonadota bacterium]